MSGGRGAAVVGLAAVGTAYLVVESIVRFAVLSLAFDGVRRMTQRQGMRVLCTECPS